ncbi:adenosine monophosphate-protein transferase [Candidatus Gottesmanbacteria bacterium RBG_16_43_7]|uniref:Adenosine monophosphate-protein transferase n=1 Tax=Candidatus Gottesmanbacteria bacterium RBG_16_43_7 TaxID=1798373 RepID=A0A1F5ZC28_9BACT|nr:MAG: adenosine monophosphate-protein transferase [Candidatus Gottesmanbacteria bacterium RBG_16_43_7]
MTEEPGVKFQLVNIYNPHGVNLIFGQSHFIKTVEDVHEAVVAAVPDAKFGLAFAEASGARLIRSSGTSPAMVSLAVKNARIVSCGHTFFLFLKNLYPINILNALKNVAEIVTIYAATGNQLQVIIAESRQGRGVMGVIDGSTPRSVEKSTDLKYRIALLRQLGYKLS